MEYQKNSKNSSETVTNKNDKKIPKKVPKETPKERNISPEERQKNYW